MTTPEKTVTHKKNRCRFHSIFK